MFNKINTRYLVVTFLVLLVLALVLMPEKNNKKNRSFNSELATYDTTDVSEISIMPKAFGEPIELRKKSGKWFVASKDGEFNADKSQIENMLNTLSGLRAKRLVARGKDKWKNYEVTDSLGTRIKVNGGKKLLGDIYIGKFSYKQPAQSVNPYMQRQQQGTMTTFVRLAGEKDIFAVDGFLSMTFNRAATDFMDQTVIKLENNNVKQLKFSGAGGNFYLNKQGGVWMLDGIVADSANTESFISDISYLTSREFHTSGETQNISASHSLIIEMEGGTEPIVVNAYKIDTSSIVVSSSLNEGMLFDGSKSELFNKIFKSKYYFLKQEFIN